MSNNLLKKIGSNGQLSIEFLASLLLLLLIISMLITTNLNFKSKIENKINYKSYNEKMWLLEKKYLEENNGVANNGLEKRADHAG